MSHACPERLAQARELAGFNKTELADAIGVSAAAIGQWEAGVKNPTAENLAELARKTDVPMALLSKPFPLELNRKGPLTFRAWSSASKRRANRKAKRLAEMIAEIFLWLDERMSFPNVELPEIDSAAFDIEKIQHVAQSCRRAWGLGDRPILKLGELLESNGIVISPIAFGDDRVDAFSCIVNGRPFIFLGNEKKDRARSRFDAAHELGHLILHQHLSDDDFLNADIRRRVESEANLFAAAFLMPSDLFKLDVLDVSLNGFLKQKPKWAVSAQAMVHWAYDLELISKGKYEDLFRQMSMKGWRQSEGEPLDDMVPSITGTLGKRSLEMLEREGILHSWEIPSDLPLPLHILCGVFDSGADRFEPEKIIRLEPNKSVDNLIQEAKYSKHANPNPPEHLN